MNRIPEPTEGDRPSMYPQTENNLTEQGTGPRRTIQLRARRDTPIVTYSLMGITIIVFLLQQASIFLLNGTDLPAVFGMKVNELILDGQIWRLFTPMFLHGSILHLGFNMYALYIFGPGLERAYGHGRYSALYLLAGFAGKEVGRP